MRRWNVFDRLGPEVNNPNQTIGMFLAEAYQKIAQLQVTLNNDPMQMEFVEQQIKEFFDLGAGLCLTGMIANSMNSKEHDNPFLDGRNPLRSFTSWKLISRPSRNFKETWTELAVNLDCCTDDRMR